MFDGIFKLIYDDKTAVNLCLFGGSRKKHDFKPFFSVFGVNFYLIHTNLIGIMCYSEFY